MIVCIWAQVQKPVDDIGCFRLSGIKDLILNYHILLVLQTLTVVELGGTFRYLQSFYPDTVKFLNSDGNICIPSGKNHTDAALLPGCPMLERKIKVSTRFFVGLELASHYASRNGDNGTD